MKIPMATAMKPAGRWLEVDALHSRGLAVRGLGLNSYTLWAPNSRT